MRPIDADALMEYCNNLKDKTIDANDIARFPTACGWISVKDRLPEEHADEHSYEFEQFLCSTVWDDVRMVGFGTRIGDDKQHFWSGNSIWDDRVTHWMPLPEPPKEDEP
jgi:hypothetical protein